MDGPELGRVSAQYDHSKWAGSTGLGSVERVKEKMTQLERAPRDQILKNLSSEILVVDCIDYN